MEPIKFLNGLKRLNNLLEPDMRNYWCFRIDNGRIPFFWKELLNGKLRQGWGYDQRQDLRNLTFDGGAKRNLPMFHKVKKGDILLVPYLPEWGKVALIEAAEDWNKGYQFEIEVSQKSDWNEGDYGHIFPAKFITSFVRHNEKVSGNIRNTLRNPSRFWNISAFEHDIQQILNASDDLSKPQKLEDRLDLSIGEIFKEVFQEDIFKNKIYSKLTNSFQSGEWETLLVQGLRELYPDYIIEPIGGRLEVHHGTDILIKIPGIFSTKPYLIAVQVKDWSGIVPEKVIEQVNKADKYFANNEDGILIEKWVILTKAPREANIGLTLKDDSVKFMFTEDLKELLNKVAKKIIHKNFLRETE